MRTIILLAGSTVVSGALSSNLQSTIERCLVDAGVPIDARCSAGWNEHASPFNVRLPYLPVAISVPTTVKHIEDSVKCGRKLGIKVSAKSGGHSYASFGFGGENGHLVVELERMHEITYNATSSIATVQPGVRLGHLATFLYEQHGRAVAHGTCPGYVTLRV